MLHVQNHTARGQNHLAPCTRNDHLVAPGETLGVRCSCKCEPLLCARHRHRPPDLTLGQHQKQAEISGDAAVGPCDQPQGKASSSNTQAHRPWRWADELSHLRGPRNEGEAAGRPTPTPDQQGCGSDSRRATCTPGDLASGPWAKALSWGMV